MKKLQLSVTISIVQLERFKLRDKNQSLKLMKTLSNQYFGNVFSYCNLKRFHCYEHVILMDNVIVMC